MAEVKCLRNMSCTCPLCAGEDLAFLQSISKSITSNISYTGEGEDEADAEMPPPPPATLGKIGNSPPLPSRRKEVSTRATLEAATPSAPLPPSRPPRPLAAQIETQAIDDVVMVEVSNGPTPPAAPAPAAAAPAASSVSLDEIVPKLTDKNWKIRKEGFDEVKTFCEQPGIRTDDVLAFIECFPKMCEDANASAMESGIQAVLAYTVNVEPFQKSIVAPVMKRVTDKGFSGRPGIVKLCEELVQAFVEAGAAEDTVTSLLEGTKNKKPKVPPACLASILEALKAFGPRVVPITMIKAALPTLCESIVNGVRPAALNIIVEIHRWTGPAMVQDIVSNLRQAQQTEYESATKDMVVGQAVPTKYVRGAKKPTATTGKTASGVGADSSGGAAPAPTAFDPREFADTVDLLAKLPKTDFKAKLAEPKWSSKVEGLKIVLDLIGSIPKLANGDYYELMGTLKLLSNDSNVNIVAKSIEVIGALSDGLRRNFNQYAKLMFAELLRKLSDKKSVILNATNNALDNFIRYSITIDMIMDEIKLGLDASKNKAPQARVQIIAFLARCAEKGYVDMSDKRLVLDFGGMFVSGMDDTDPTVRKAGSDSLIVLLKVSEQTSEWLQSVVEDLARKNPRAYKTVIASVGPATAKIAKSTPSATKSSPSAAVPEPMEIDISEPSRGSTTAASPAASRLAAKGSVRGPPSRLGAKPAAASKPAPLKKPVGTTGGTGGGASNGGSTEFTPIAISVAPEDAEALVEELSIESWSEIQAGLASAKWMERKTAIELLENYAKENSSVMTMRVIEAMTLYISKQVKSFKDSNINVLKSAFQAIGVFAEKTASKFPRGVVCLVVPSAADKISDRKASETIRAMLLQFCEATSPSYTLGCLMNYMPSVKAPLAHIEALVAIGECLKDFGATVCNPRSVIDFVKGGVGLESSNPKVRTSAISVLGIMYSQLGPALLPILNLESWKPALAAIVEAEFKKVGFDPSSAMASVKRQIKDDDEGGGGKKADAGALFGRVDISSQITKELFADMKCEDDKTAWKKRSAAMDTVQSICEGAGGAIEFTKVVAELLRALKARLTDSNANLKVKAAQVIGIVAASIGPDVAKMSKILGTSLLSGVSDNKKSMQSASIEALHRWVRHNNQTSPACVESLLSAVSEALLNPVGRAELLGWAAEHLKSCEKVDLTCLVVPTVQCLMDKSSEAREKAQLVLAEVIKSVGKDIILTTGCRDIKPAQMRTLKPILDKVSESIVDAPAATPVPTIAAPPQQLQVSTAAVEFMPQPSPGLSRPSLLQRKSVGASAGIGSRPQLPRTGSLREEISTPREEPIALLKMSGTKVSRLTKGQYNKWIFDTNSLSEMNNRKSEIEAEWRPFLAPEFHAKLFAPSLEKGMMAAINDLSLCVSNQPQELLASLDLVLKWCTLRIVDNNVQALAKLLDFLVYLFEMLKGMSYQLDDVEASILLPYLLQESGQSKPRFRVRFRDIMRLIVDSYSTEKYVPYLMDCFNTSKNMKSRCECIDLIEFIVTASGFHTVGKKCVKEIGKYVVAHEKELRESAINALVAVYTRTDGNVDKFFRFTGVTTQQGMDLLSGRIKHLPPGSFAENTSTMVPPQQHTYVEETVSAPSHIVQPLPAHPSVPVMPSIASPVGSTAYVNHMPVATASSMPLQHSTITRTQEEDVVMASPSKNNSRSDSEDLVEELVLRPIDGLLTESNEIVVESSPAFTEGVDALKTIYSFFLNPRDDSETEFLQKYASDIMIKLCDLIHACFWSGDSKKPIVLYILSLCLTNLVTLLESNAADCVQRRAVERLQLEMSSKMLDPRFTEFTTATNHDISAMSPHTRRYFYLFRAFFKITKTMSKNLKPGEVYPAAINLLQRIVRNDVGDYNARDSFNHLLKNDSLDQMVGRLLIQLTTTQTQALNPFEGIDVFGVLMQMHSFFSTLPQGDPFAVQIANDNMQTSLRMMAECLLKQRSSVFEASLNDLPITSPVRELLSGMGLLPNQSQPLNGFAANINASLSSRSNMESSAAAHSTHSSTSEDSGVDTVTRRLFGAAPSTTSSNGSADDTDRPLPSRESLRSRPSMQRFRASVSGLSVATTSSATTSRSSYPSFDEFSAATRLRSSMSVSAAEPTANGDSTRDNGRDTTRDLRARLEQVRGF